MTMFLGYSAAYAYKPLLLCNCELHRSQKGEAHCRRKRGSRRHRKLIFQSVTGLPLLSSRSRSIELGEILLCLYAFIVSYRLIRLKGYSSGDIQHLGVSHRPLNGDGGGITLCTQFRGPPPKVSVPAQRCRTSISGREKDSHPPITSDSAPERSDATRPTAATTAATTSTTTSGSTQPRRIAVAAGSGRSECRAYT